MADPRKDIAQKLAAAGQTDAFEKAVESDDSMELMNILQSLGLGPTLITRVLMQGQGFLRGLIEMARDPVNPSSMERAS